MADLDFTDEQRVDPANFAEAITHEQMESMEDAAKSSARAVQRRLVLLACASSSDKLRQLSLESPDAFIEMLDMIEIFREHAQGLFDLAESALARMLLAGGAGEKSAGM